MTCRLVGNCRKCGYSLMRLTEPRCPECGTGFDPGDPRTMKFHEPRMAEAFLIRPTTVWTVGPAVLVSAAAVVSRVYWAGMLWSHLLAVVAVGMMAGTCYVVLVRRSFRRFLKKRQRVD